MFGSFVPVRPDVHGQIVVGPDKTEGDNKMPVEGAQRRGISGGVSRRQPATAMLHALTRRLWR
jgi:hypothetical protein